MRTILTFLTLLLFLGQPAAAEFDPDKPFGFKAPYRYRISFDVDQSDGRWKHHVYVNTWIRTGKGTPYIWLGNPHEDLLPRSEGQHGILLLANDCTVYAGAGMEIFFDPHGFRRTRTHDQGGMAIPLTPLEVYDVETSRLLVKFADRSDCGY